MNDALVSFLILFGGPAVFVWILILLDSIARRHDRKRAEKYEQPM